MPDSPSDPFGGAQLDFTLRQMQANIDSNQRNVDDLNNLLRGYTSQQVAGFDLSGIPNVYEMLARQLGNWAGVASAVPGFTVLNASVGSTPKITFVPSIITDATNGGTIWHPTGDPLTVGGSDTVAYIDSTVDATTGFITASAFAKAATMPASTSTHWYLFLSTITVTTGATASVAAANDGWTGPIIFAICGTYFPITDGVRYRWGT